MGVFSRGAGLFPNEGSEGLRCGIGKRYPASPDDIPALRAGTISEPAAQTISAARTGGERKKSPLRGSMKCSCAA